MKSEGLIHVYRVSKVFFPLSMSNHVQVGGIS
jgi:hypothetical protein